MPLDPLLPQRQFPLVEKATDLSGLPRAFRPEPLIAEEMDEFYSESLDRRRGRHQRRAIANALLSAAEQGFFFKGIVYGNRGTGKSTEVNRLLTDPEIDRRFVVIRLDAVEELNPQTSSVADVLLLTFFNLIEGCRRQCEKLGRAFHEADIMTADLQQVLSPFFPELQNKEQLIKTVGGGGEVSLFSILKASIRVEGQRKMEMVAQRESLTALKAALERQITAVRDHVPEYELLVVGENFDKEQIPQTLLEETFVSYGGLLRDLRLHLLFMLPFPFVYRFGEGLAAFRRENRYPLYDVSVYNPEHHKDEAGCHALIELLKKRADIHEIFTHDALELLLRASGGDLYRLFAMIVRSGWEARYRHEDVPASDPRVLFGDAENIVLEQLGIFRNELGSGPEEQDAIPWEVQRDKLRAIYEGSPEANVPDAALHRLLRKRAVLFFNGRGRYGVHPMAVEILREQFAKDPTFRYRGGGLDLPQ